MNIYATDVAATVTYEMGSYLKNLELLLTEDSCGCTFEVYNTYGCKFRYVFNFVAQSYILSAVSSSGSAETKRKLPLLRSFNGNMVYSMYQAIRIIESGNGTTIFKNSPSFEIRANKKD